MPVFILNFLIAALLAMASFAMGWFLRSRIYRVGQANRADQGKQPAALQDPSKDSQEVMAHLQELAIRMAADVDAHSSRVQEISEELNDSEGQKIEDVVGVVAKIIDANTRMQQKLDSAEEKLHQQAQEIETQTAQARTDALTMLANRRVFDEEIMSCFTAFRQSQRSVSIMMIDVDHFKRFNDTHGHQAGDQVLRGVARTLRRSVEQPAIVARYGGEEFAIVFPGMTATNAQSLAEQARAAIAKASFEFEGKTLKVTVSTGLAELRPGEDAKGLVSRADEALYASKQAGRNCGHWHDGSTSHPLAQPEKKASEQDSSAATTAPTKPQPATTRLEAMPSGNNDSSDHDDTESLSELQDLMGLSDRMSFLEDVNRRFAAWKRGGETLSIIMIQIDHFQRIKNHQGSDAGDLVLKTLTMFLKGVMREMDHVSRFDDDTFALLLPTANLTQAMTVAERLRQAILRFELPRGGNRRRFTVSIGVTEVVQGDDSQMLMERTQIALDTSVENGRNCSFQHTGQQCEPVEVESISTI